MRTTFHRLCALTLVIAASTTAMAGVATAQPQSQAIALDAKLSADGVDDELGPVGQVNGRSTGKYDSRITVARLTDSLAVGSALGRPILTVNASGLDSHASASGYLVDSRGSTADNSLTSATLTLDAEPPIVFAASAGPAEVPAAGTPAPALKVVVKSLVSSANFNVVYGGKSFLVGATTVGSLTISGQILGSAKVSYSGQVAPNTVVYASPTLKVTLNKQVTSASISCNLTCKFAPSAIDVVAIDIELTKAKVGKSKVSGEIKLSEAAAQ